MYNQGLIIYSNLLKQNHQVFSIHHFIEQTNKRLKLF